MPALEQSSTNHIATSVYNFMVGCEIAYRKAQDIEKWKTSQSGRQHIVSRLKPSKLGKAYSNYQLINTG